jgi:hypothetical protein
MPRNTITKIHITSAMYDLFIKLIVSSPWFRTKAKHCVISSDNTLEFDYEVDAGKLMELVNAARKFGFRADVVRAFKNRILAGTQHARALEKKAA